MKVAELIAKLQDENPDGTAEVWIETSCGTGLLSSVELDSDGDVILQ